MSQELEEREDGEIFFFLKIDKIEKEWKFVRERGENKDETRLRKRNEEWIKKMVIDYGRSS